MSLRDYLKTALQGVKTYVDTNFVNKSQGTSNAGKYLTVGTDGKISLRELGLQITPILEENVPATFAEIAQLETGLYFAYGYKNIEVSDKHTMLLTGLFYIDQSDTVVAITIYDSGYIYYLRNINSNWSVMSYTSLDGFAYRDGEALKTQIANTYVAKSQGTANANKFLGIGSDGNVTPVDAPSGGSEYTLPIATSDTLGGVKPVAKTETMTQEVGVDENGGLFTLAGGGSDGTWKLLASITTVEDVTDYTISQDMDGNSFECDEFIYYEENTTGSSTGYRSVLVNGMNCLYYIMAINTGYQCCINVRLLNNGMCHAYGEFGQLKGVIPMNDLKLMGCGLSPRSDFSSFKSFTVKNITNMAGQVIKIYGKVK